MKEFRKSLFCFSPPVMLATFMIEIVLALYVVWRYKFDNVTKLVVLLLTFLATFQLAEYMVCEVAGLSPLTWSRIGYIAITLLPPLGVHLAYELAESKKRPLLMPAYAAAAGFGVFFAVIGQSIQSQACLGNYVIFHMAPGSGWLYALYYYGLVVGAMALCVHLAKTANEQRRKALNWLAAGYGAFLIPTTTVNILAPETIAGIPSIMCGFAVVLAVILAIFIMPAVGSKKWTSTLRLS